MPSPRTAPPYGVLCSTYWEDEQMRTVASTGGRDALLVGACLQSMREATMLGLFPLDLLVLRARLFGLLNDRQVAKAFTSLSAADFAYYDQVTRVVWVREMAVKRLQLHNGPMNLAKDTRVSRVRKLYEALPQNPFLGPFFDRYASDIHLQVRRDYLGPVKYLGKAPALSQGMGEGMPHPMPPDPAHRMGRGVSQGVSVDQRSGISDQAEQDLIRDQEEQGQEQRADARQSRWLGDDNPRLLINLAHKTWDAVDRGDITESQVYDDLKHRVPRGVRYDGDRITKALNAAGQTRPIRRLA